MTEGPQPAGIGKYAIERVLGRGAMGVVYLARDPMIKRLVAIKTVFLPQGLEPQKITEFRERFLREARAAGQMNHPSIVTIYEADDGSSGGPPFIAMEYIQGETWSAKIKRGEKADPGQLFTLVREIASGLAYAHKAGVVHRDIKPANIISTPDGHAKLTDFGIARVPASELTQEGQFLGTPAYMAPEQITGKGVDGRSDLFSLGTVIFEMLTGSKPFPGEDITVVTHKILMEPPEPMPEKCPGMPSEVGCILNKLLTKNPAERYQSAEQLAEDLDAYLGGSLPPHAGTEAAAEATAISDPLPQPSAAIPPKPNSPFATHSDAAAASNVPDQPPQATPAPPTAQSKRLKWLLPAVLAAFGLVLVLGAAGGFLWWWTHRAAPPAVVLPSPEFTPQSGSQPAAAASEQPSIEQTESRPPASEAATPAAKPSKPKTHATKPSSPQASSSPASSIAASSQPPPAAQARPAKLEVTFTAGVLKGEYWLKVDGKTVANEKIDRKFSLKKGSWSNSVSVPTGSHLVSFEIVTDIQDVKTQHEERAEFASGETRTLQVRLSKLKKDLEFEWN